MDKLRRYNLNNAEHIEYLLHTITDDMAVNSDAEGDDDADDADDRLSKLSSNNSFADSSLGHETPNDMDEEVFEAMHEVEEEVSETPTMGNIDEGESDSSGEENNSDNKEAWDRRSTVPKRFAETNFDRRFGITRFAKFNILRPSSIFLNVLTPMFLQYLVDQSNIYASQCGQILNLTLPELKAYIGILIIMGFHSLPSMRLYWSTDINFSVSRIQNVMPVKRFLKITRYLHLNDNSVMPKKGENGYDKLYKIRPFLDYVSKKFRMLFDPSRYLSIDESMVKYKGRCSLKQYMPMKPIKRGFKIWVIACAVTGYCLDMSLYEGAEINSDKSTTLGERVVNNLSTVFQGLGYCLFFDNFFSSITLAKTLLEKKLFCCATIQQRRKFFPNHILKSDKSMKKGDSDGVILENTGVSKWKDRGKKSVCVISTMHDPQKITKVLRTQKDGSRKLVDCPESVAEYNKYMGGVDHFDQLLSAYSISWKSRRWWLRIFYYCLDACIVNSYILYKITTQQISQNKKPMAHLTFRSVLASELIGAYSGRIKPGPSAGLGRGRKRNHPDGRSTVHNATRLNNVGKHLPKEGTRRRCCYCSTAQKQQRSSLVCEECNVALCLKCFIPFHKA